MSGYVGVMTNYNSVTSTCVAITKNADEARPCRKVENSIHVSLSIQDIRFHEYSCNVTSIIQINRECCCYLLVSFTSKCFLPSVTQLGTA